MNKKMKKAIKTMKQTGLYDALLVSVKNGYTKKDVLHTIEETCLIDSGFCDIWDDAVSKTGAEIVWNKIMNDINEEDAVLGGVSGLFTNTYGAIHK